ncbi:hypothetical protein L6452_13871 [Arctium lappa]|uniref:Uncharacterized protein n=1 Tax=Arctium lappa TaxID=4217 RepID=A0ACB9CJQ9_ARCLA|nr:hypothetical protein L6452_13871 [Arctium lappa]
MTNKIMKFSNFKFPSITFRGKSDKQSTTSFVKEMDVNQEYLEAFRTKSYIDICKKVQTHIGSSSSSVHDHHVHLCDILLEPQNETIANLVETFGVHHLVLDFFQAGLEAWQICEQLLESVHQANANHRKVKRVVKLAQRVPDAKRCRKIYEELASYSSSVNPLSAFDPEKFPKLHTNHKQLLKRLTAKHTRIIRKQKLITFLKKSGGCALIASYAVLAVVLLVLACHGLVVTVAAPGLIGCFLGFTKKRGAGKTGVKTSELKRVGVQLDMAAKGVYTMIKDLDTMGWLVGRLHNEVEFGRAMARKCVGNRKPDVLEEVMKEFRVHESCFLEQLEELEDHIYLCLLNVNRSRRLLVEEIMPS